MKKILILFIAILPLLAFTEFHKFYVSVTEMEYNEKSKSLQVISRVFTDDMENLLKTRYSKDLYITKEDEHASADAYIRKYLDAKLQVEVNGEARAFNYLGKEYDNDQLVLYIEVENVAQPIKSVNVRNEVLTDLFDDQKNVVHVTYKGKTKSLLLSRFQKDGELKF